MTKVSIIMPYYNAAKYIKETVGAIVAQSYQDWELIIVDDYSTAPETSAILHNIEAMDSRIKVINAKINGGAGAARNLGITVAKGRYLAFCDSDDWWYPDKLAKQLSFMQANKYSFVCSYYEDADENLKSYYTMKQPLVITAKDLKYGCSIGTPGVIYDTEVIGKVLMPSMRRGEDWVCWLNIIKRAREIHVFPESLWKYRHRSDSETSNKFIMIKNVIEVYQKAFGYSKIKSILVTFLIFIPKNILKKVRKLN